MRLRAIDYRVSQSRRETPKAVASAVVRRIIKHDTVKAEREFSKSLAEQELAMYFDEVQERMKAAEERLAFELQLDVEAYKDCRAKEKRVRAERESLAGIVRKRLGRLKEEVRAR